MIKSIIFPILKYFLAAKKKPVGYAFLTYHNISNDGNLIIPDPMTLEYSNFKQQMNYLSNQFKVISVSEIIERISSKDKADKLYISITFDDGFLSQYKMAVPILKSLNYPATFFITTNYADQVTVPLLERLKYYLKISQRTIKVDYNNKINGIYNLQKKDEKIRLYNNISKILTNDEENLNDYLTKIFNEIEIPRIYMNWEEIIQLNNNPKFTIGGHSVTHNNLLNVPNVLESEINKSRDIICNKLSGTCNYFAYPFGIKGTVNNNLFGLVKKSGYNAAFTSFSGLNNKPNSIYEINRIAPLGGENLDKLLIRIFWAKEINTYRKFITK